MEEKKCKLSIIIPVYNAAAFLEGCLDSLCRQTCDDFEVILIDDGSTDNSLAICRKYVAADKRFRCASQVNAGAGAARNHGLQMAQGEFICFVDADDWVDAKYVEQMLAVPADVDLVVADATIHDGDNVQPMTFDAEAVNRADTLTGKLQQLVLTQSDYWAYAYLWNKRFKHEVISRNDLCFNTEMHIAEDEVFLLDYLEYCHSLKVLAANIYHYRLRNGASATAPWLSDYSACCERLYQAAGYYKRMPLCDYFLVRWITYWFDAQHKRTCTLRRAYNEVCRLLPPARIGYLQDYVNKNVQNHNIVRSKRTLKFIQLALADRARRGTWWRLQWLCFYSWQKKLFSRH